jgi:hypothetical protein
VLGKAWRENVVVNQHEDGIALTRAKNVNKAEAKKPGKHEFLC